MNLIGEVDVRKSTAYFEKDRKRIFSAIESHESVKMDDLNMLVMSELRKWLIAEGLTVLMKHWPQKSKIRLPDSIFVERDLNRSEKKRFNVIITITTIHNHLQFKRREFVKY